MSIEPLTFAGVESRLRAVEPRIRELGVRRLALFGSVVRGEARPDSDVDLLVEFAPGEKSYRRFMALYDLMEEVSSSGSSWSPPRRSRRSSVRTSSPKQPMSSEPREQVALSPGE